MNSPSIEEAQEFQRNLGLLDTHVVWMGFEGFAIAHTDAERESIPLVGCALHSWMSEREGPLKEVYDDGEGWYVVRRREHDPTSESFPSDAYPWIFERLPDPAELF